MQANRYLSNNKTLNGSDHITLAELQTTIRNVLSAEFAAPVWVSAEIADIKVNGSGHCYLELIDKGEADGGNGVPKAQARAVIWRSNVGRIFGRFENESGQRLERGIKVLVCVTVNYHELYGLSLQIIDIDPTYTLGEMERRKQEAIARLKSEGVWDMNREVGLPPIVQRIAVISSSNAAGYQDFRNELAKSGYAFTLTLFDSVMQGTASEESIIGSLEQIAGRQELFDAVVIIRGGGSASDLNCFNSYRLAAHVAQFPLPVITGIGHDKDTSVADMVACLALKTPTAVAVWLNERMLQADGALDYAALQLHELLTATMRKYEIALERAANRLEATVESVIAEQGMLLQNAATILKDSAARALENERHKIGSLAELAESHSPRRIMRLGFAVARIDGRVVTSVSQARDGERMSIEVADGTIMTTVKK